MHSVTLDSMPTFLHSTATVHSSLSPLRWKIPQSLIKKWKLKIINNINEILDKGLEVEV